ncbi:MAG: hypothetical protein RL676_1153 [Pseudomonadota bacterium]|jgi:hypothetical protein
MNKYLKNGLAGGLSLAFFHLCWIVIVALGWGQPILDFIFKIHMLNSPLQVQPFNPAYALTLIVVTFSVGFVMGAVIGASACAIKPSTQDRSSLA